MSSKSISSNKNTFATLLHIGLKIENLVGIVCLSEEWYGAVHCWQEPIGDNKRKSNLMLTIFMPGISKIFKRELLLRSCVLPKNKITFF